jgi:peroxiredoxin Q/BCP
MMFRIMKVSAAAALIAAPLCLQAQQSGAPMAGMSMTAATSMSAPEVGTMAPDFSAKGANMMGEQSVSLKSLRGQVVVLAFYPKDRSSGCTHEMNKFRDEFTKIFGSKTTVLPVSEDDVESHTGWARDSKFPFTLVTDTNGEIAGAYGSMMAGRPYASRTVFVIGKDGKIAYRNMKFGALDQHAYDDLAAAVAKANAD